MNASPSKQEPHDGKENQPSADDPVVVEMVLNDGGTYKVTRSEAERYQVLYPAVDVMQELRNAAGWLEGNPTRRKTKAGIKRYINGWLAKEQDKGGGKAVITRRITRRPANSPVEIHLRGDGYGRQDDSDGRSDDAVAG